MVMAAENAPVLSRAGRRGLRRREETQKRVQNLTRGKRTKPGRADKMKQQRTQEDLDFNTEQDKSTKSRQTRTPQQRSDGRSHSQLLREEKVDQKQTHGKDDRWSRGGFSRVSLCHAVVTEQTQAGGDELHHDGQYLSHCDPLLSSVSHNRVLPPSLLSFCKMTKFTKKKREIYKIITGYNLIIVQTQPIS